MKLLKIDNACGHFRNSENTFDPIDRITKEDLLRIIDLTLSEDVEFDEYDEDILQNQAHQIIYKNILDKLIDLRNRKQEFQDESERLFLNAYEKYQEKPAKQDSESKDSCS